MDCGMLRAGIEQAGTESHKHARTHTNVADLAHAQQAGMHAYTFQSSMALRLASTKSIDRAQILSGYY